MKADAQGHGTSTTILNGVSNIQATGWFINVHNGPTLSPAIQKAPITCGDIKNPNPSTTTNQSVHLTLGPAPTIPDEAASGQATLSLSGQTLTVTITMAGLDPKITQHIAHIHQGSCDAQGAVLIPLNPVVVDASGAGTSSTTKTVTFNSIPATGWYVNVHLASSTQELSTQTGFDPITCGNVIT